MKYLFASFFICFSVSVSAQQHHFIYIQADNRQPFYVRLDNKILSSSAAGYLIIPQLTDSSYDLSIGFPKDEWPQQKVTCIINKNDLGYLLKNFGEKGWGLFNLQTMDLVMADNKAKPDGSNKMLTGDDAFSNALSNVVNDPTIKVVNENKDDSVMMTAAIKKAPEKKLAKDAVKNKRRDLVVIRSKERISKLVSRRNTEGLKMVYVDKINGITDTINVVIPSENPVVRPGVNKSVGVIKPAGSIRSRALAKPDTAALARHIASVKKTVKKPAKVRCDIAKTDNKIPGKGKDTASLIIPAIKVEGLNTEVVQENKNGPDPNDTTNTVKASKKLEEIIADIAKNNETITVPAKDTVKAVQPEIKPAENNGDIALTQNKKEQAVDSAAKHPVDITMVMPKEAPKMDVVAVDSLINNSSSKQPDKSVTELVKDDLPANKVVDSKLNTVPTPNLDESKPEPAKETANHPVTQHVDRPVTITGIKADVKKVEPIVPDKRAAEQVVVEKQKEEIVPKTNSGTAAPIYTCKYVADGDEFMGLRKKMLKGKSDNEMLFYAHQLFLKRCVTTKQVERLGLLFNNDLARYNLFDDAYHFSADPDIFPTLQSQLTDDYYIKRFKAMLRK